MKIKILILSMLCLTGLESIIAQEIEKLSLKEAVEIAVKNSDEAKLSETKITTAQSELKVVKNNRYPDLNISGQYLRLANADVKLKVATGSVEQSTDGEEGNTNSTAKSEVHQLVLGQANVSLPLFSGFKLKNLIGASENQLQAAILNSKSDKDKIALQTIQDYINLYKASKTITLIEENLESAQQRVKNFSVMEQNGLLARNDLLKAQLQEATIRVSLEEARKNERILNYKLAIYLKLSENTWIETNDTDFGISMEAEASGISRSDVEALRYTKKAAENQIKVAKSGYYPSVALKGGYIALDIQNTLTVTNAANIGLGISYNLANIFKSKSEVKLAKSRVQEIKYQLSMATDQAKVQVKNAEQEYELALRKFEVYNQSKVQAAENYRIVEDKYNNGLSDINDLLEADVQQLQAQINAAYAKADITQRYYELLAAQGTISNQFIN